MSQPLISIASAKTGINLSPVKTTVSQGMKPLGVAFSATSTPTATSSTVSIPNLRNKLQDKAKVTIAMIQELTEDLQSMDLESVVEEPESVMTQESDLEQEDSEEYLTEPEDQ